MAFREQEKSMWIMQITNRNQDGIHSEKTLSNNSSRCWVPICKKGSYNIIGL